MPNLHGEEVKITVTKVGGKQEEMISYVYDLPLIDSVGEIVLRISEYMILTEYQQK